CPEPPDVGEMTRDVQGAILARPYLDRAGKAGDAKCYGEHRVDAGFLSAAHIVGRARLATFAQEMQGGGGVTHVQEISSGRQRTDADVWGQSVSRNSREHARELPASMAFVLARPCQVEEARQDQRNMVPPCQRL